MLKTAAFGYDGKGQVRLSGSLDQNWEEIWNAFGASRGVLEKLIAFEREISVIGARDEHGKVSVYDCAENLHFEGQLHVSVAPATQLESSLKEQAKSIFEKVALGLDYIGVLAVELFQVGGQLLVNEIAPRVHNSGHWTQDGADTCQFEQHTRAVLGFPLGSTRTQHVTAMVNIIGCTNFSRDLISIEGCHLHWYGKTLREKRKMGHINVVADNYHELGDKLLSLLDYLPHEHFPLLQQEAQRLKSL
jgi:5-(carboxyamino)imidazole ribonucleotide synthase